VLVDLDIMSPACRREQQAPCRRVRADLEGGTRLTPPTRGRRPVEQDGVGGHEGGDLVVE